MFNNSDKKEEPVQAAQPSEFPRKESSHNGTNIGYTVEVRYTGHKPAIINDMVLGKEWQRPKFDAVQPPIPGVPTARPWNAALFSMLGLYDYSAAEALRWWFHANADATGIGAMCVESRIVAHRVKYSMSEEAISEHSIISGEDRTSIVPDWNTEKQPTR